MIIVLILLSLAVGLEAVLLVYLVLSVWNTAKAERFPLPEIGALMAEGVNEAVKRSDERTRKRMAGLPTAGIAEKPVDNAKEAFEKILQGKV